MTITITPRAQWKARPPKRVHRITIPTRDLWLHHTAGNESGAAGMRQIQNMHMDEKGWSDIAYSFVVDPTDNVIYEGRGAGVAGGHTAGHNTTSHAICVMGNFDIEQPSPTLLRTIADLIRHGRDNGWWGDLTGGHRDASGASTACPGKHLQAAIPEIRALSNATTPEEPFTVSQYEAIMQELREIKAGVLVSIDTANKALDRANSTYEKIVPTETVRADIRLTRDIAAKLGVSGAP